MWLHLVVLSFLNYYQVIELLVWPYTTFILGAFGFHSLATQTNVLKGSNENADDPTQIDRP